MSNDKILLTGGTGYIGSHACAVLQAQGYDVVILDNLVNSHAHVIDQLEKISGIRPVFVQGDVRDQNLLHQLFKDHTFSAVIHFAALKAVGESIQKPLEYFDVNISGMITLLKAMEAADVKTLVFSSSATVYGDPQSVPIKEDFPRSTTNPYGRTKLVIEHMLEDLVQADSTWKIARLRYFNPVGAHSSGLIGEDPQGIPNNLTPYIAKVALGELPSLKIYGSDYPTPDGTGVRDYIHVVDLAEGHVKALAYLKKNPGLLTVNLGTGKGYSVLEVLKAFEKACGHPIPYETTDRRSGDIAKCWADPSLATQLLGWKAIRTLDDMCESSWKWVSGSSSKSFNTSLKD